MASKNPELTIDENIIDDLLPDEIRQISSQMSPEGKKILLLFLFVPLIFLTATFLFQTIHSEQVVNADGGDYSSDLAFVPNYEGTYQGYVVVQAGQCLYQIARQLIEQGYFPPMTNVGLLADKIAQQNGLVDPNALFPNQQLEIPLEIE
jgi:hypothetical protein